MRRHEPPDPRRAANAPRRAPVNPSEGAIAPTRIEVRADRTVLPGQVWAAESPRALVGVIHGLGEYGARYAAFASDLVRAGYTVAAVDWPGHGEAPGPRGDVPSWIAFRDQVVPALLGAHQTFARQPERLPHVVFGHSMGGVMALDFALAHPQGIAGVAVSAPGLRSAIPPWWKLALANVARVTAPSVGFPHGLPEGAMSRDPEVMRLRKDDPVMHDRISPRLYAAFTEARQRVIRDARRLQVPALVMHGEADDVVYPSGSAEFAAAAPRGLVRHRTYSGGFHEIFNDPARDAAMKDLIAWLRDVVG